MVKRHPTTKKAFRIPLAPMGEQKLRRSKIIAKLYPQAAIIRASLMYGIDPADHQTRWLLNGMEKKETVRLFTDESRSPIWVKTLAASLLELAESDFSGVLHIAGPESFSRWDFGMKMLDLLHRVPTGHYYTSNQGRVGVESSTRSDARYSEGEKIAENFASLDIRGSATDSLG